MNINDIPLPSNDQSVSTISGTHVSQVPIFKNLPQRRIQHSRRPQQQQQTNKSSHGNETERMPPVSPAVLGAPSLMELATRSSPILLFSSTINNGDTPIVETPNKYSYETTTDPNGIHHHRLFTITDNLLRPFSKNDTPIIRTNGGSSTKMPPVNNNNGSQRRSLSQKPNYHFPQPPLATIESVLRERSMTIANENVHQPDAMERVNNILKQLYLPLEKK